MLLVLVACAVPWVDVAEPAATVPAVAPPAADADDAVAHVTAANKQIFVVVATSALPPCQAAHPLGHRSQVNSAQTASVMARTARNSFIGESPPSLAS